VRLCYEQLIGSLGSAIMAASRADNQAKSQALTRASALMALQMGVTGDDPVAGALLHLYSAAAAPCSTA
jgi:flagellar protein FliS